MSGTTVGSTRRWLALSVLCTSLFAIVLDNTIVNVALPTLVRDLDADISQLQWVVDAYTLVFAGLLLLAGTLGDRYGRRRTLLLGLGIFGAGSAAAAFAGGVDQLVLGVQVADVAREVFVHAMSRGTVVVAVMAAIGALVAWRFLPAHDQVPDSESELVKVD